VNFFGLCGIGVFNGVVYAAMPSHGNHKAVLLARADQCKIKADGQPNPDFIAHDNADVQLFGWNVSGLTLGFANTTGTAAWTTGSRDKMIDLDRFNPGAKIKLPAGAAILRLPDGALSEGPDTDVFTIIRDGKELEKGTFGASATWVGTGLSLGTSNGEIVEVKKDAMLVFTNIAPVQLGHKHFHLYYDAFFDPPPDAKEQISLEHSNVQVYDCVPPVPLP
jgi:hypothetical protein